MVLIKGAEKPRNCNPCTYFCQALTDDECPIMPLDEVIARLKAKRHETTPTIESICYNRGIDDCIEILRGFPTVDDLQEGEE